MTQEEVIRLLEKYENELTSHSFSIYKEPQCNQYRFRLTAIKRSIQISGISPRVTRLASPERPEPAYSYSEQGIV